MGQKPPASSAPVAGHQSEVTDIDSMPDIADHPLLQLAIPLRVGIETPKGPLIVPLWFEFVDGRFWCASQAGSILVRSLGMTPICAFDLSTNEMPYRGLRGRGQVTGDPSRGAEVLHRLLKRYLGSLDTPLARQLQSRKATEVAVAITPQWHTRWDFTARMSESLHH